MDPELSAALDKVIAARDALQVTEDTLNAAMLELLNLAALKSKTPEKFV